MDNVSIEIKKDQIEITKTGGQYILLRKKDENGYIAQFSHEITDTEVRRLTNTGVIDILQNESNFYLYLKTRRFHSTEMLYLIFADLLKHKNLTTITHE